MLAIRMQRTGRKGHAQFRLIVQEARLSPTSGRVVANLGHYDPHSKVVVVDKEKASFYLEHGAQPSDRIVSILKKEGVKLPKWVELADKKKGAIRNPEKLRRNRPDEPVEAAAEPAVEQTAPAEDARAEAAVVEEAPAEGVPSTDEAPAEKETAAEPAKEAKADEPAEEKAKA